jgi:hypothetical protein
MPRSRSLLCAFMAFNLGAGAASAAETAFPPGPGSQPVASAPAAAARAAAAPPNPLEMVYTPIAPCRAFGGIAQTAGQTLNYQITGTADLGSQGGPNGGCGIPASATAVSVSLTATSSAIGKIIAFARGTVRPNTVSLNYQPGKTETAGTAVALDSAGKLSIYSSAASKAYGDIVGYYAPQIRAHINATGTIRSATSRVLTAEKLSTGYYRITIDREIESCAVNATISGGTFYISAYTGSNGIYVTTWYLNGTAVQYFDLAYMIVVAC